MLLNRRLSDLQSAENPSPAEYPPLLASRSTPRLFILSDTKESLDSSGIYQSPLAKATEIRHVQTRRVDIDTSEEEIARMCVHSIRQAQPEGPYFIAGIGDAALSAYEATFQLMGADQPVAFLALIGPHAVTKQGDTDADASDNDSSGSLADYPGRHGYAVPPLPLKINVFVPASEQGAAMSRAWSHLPETNTHILRVETWTRYPALCSEFWTAFEVEFRKQCIAERPYLNSTYLPIVTIERGMHGYSPLFCVPGAGASVTSFLHLAQAIGPRVPIHGLQPRGLNDGNVPHIDVVSAARHYVEAVLRLVPNGPIHLLGHSYGGWIALEMARQLAAANRAPASLHLLDSRLPARQNEPRKRYSLPEALGRLVELYELQSTRAIGLTAADFEKMTPQQQIELLLTKLIEVKIFPPRATSMMLASVVRVFKNNLNSHYSPTEQFQSPATLVIAQSSAPFNNETLLENWASFVPNLQPWTSTGDHFSLLSPPHIDALAKHLMQTMRVT